MISFDSIPVSYAGTNHLVLVFEKKKFIRIVRVADRKIIDIEWRESILHRLSEVDKKTSLIETAEEIDNLAHKFFCSEKAEVN